jgi:hypothetical protein
MDGGRSVSDLLRRGCLRLLDGERPWGTFEIQPDRFGVIRYRLVVFPPGISISERRRVRVARGWPVWGMVAWVVCEILLSHLTGQKAVIAVSTAVCVAVAMAARAMGGQPRSQVRTIAATVMAGHHDPVSDASRDVLRNFAETLFEADERRANGVITATEHEAIWWQVYNQLDSGCSLARDVHPSNRTGLYRRNR